jgi:ketosteroid isomerase-like protein
MPIHTELTESANAIAKQLLEGISELDEERIGNLCQNDIELQVPGAREVDLTTQRKGVSAFIGWAADVKRFCGKTTFVMHRYFENGCELMAAGTIQIQRHPRTFSSPCSMLLRIEAGKVAFFQLLLDTYALDKFRGQMD